MEQQEANEAAGEVDLLLADQLDELGFDQLDDLRGTRYAPARLFGFYLRHALVRARVNVHVKSSALVIKKRRKTRPAEVDEASAMAHGRKSA
eukprot:2072180-Prymnesium_polylepis.1